MDALQQEKSTLRVRMREALKNIAHEARLEASLRIARKLTVHERLRSARYVMFYLALTDELDLQCCMESCLQERKKICIPFIASGEIKPAQLERLTAPLLPGPYGVKQTANFKPVQREEIDVVIVPGLAFDRAGHRLGRGKGYYDKFLSSCTPNTYSIGVCLPDQLLESVPVGPRDISVKEVLVV